VTASEGDEGKQPGPQRTESEAEAKTTGDQAPTQEGRPQVVVSEYTRQPIVSVLGHVDHGKTSFLDWVRGSTVVAREAGKITQHIGATEVPLAKIQEACGPLMKGKEFRVPGLLFIDTPGHAAFTSLRARGGALADIAVLAVDITEGFKPQTKEAISILKQAKTPFLVFANKVDRFDGYESRTGPLLSNLNKQDPVVQSKVDEAVYRLVGELHDMGFESERFDRVRDFRKTIAIVPGCALTGEGIPDALMLLVGLAQRFLEASLQTTEDGPAEATVLEVKEERGLGPALDTIVFAGRLKTGDTVVVGTKNEPLITRVKALLRPKPLDEIRDPKDTFAREKEIHAAAGIKVLLGETEGIAAGAPMRVITEDNEEEAIDAVLAESRPSVKLADAGIHVKADTIGSLEALAVECQLADIPIRQAAVGPVSRRDVTAASAETDRLHRAVLAFNVKTLPDAQEAINDTEVKLISGDVIYTLMEEYQDWYEGASRDVDAEMRKQIVHPGKLLFLEDHTFRVSNPAIIGIRVVGGRVAVGHKLMREDGRSIGEVKSIRLDDTNVQEAKQGNEVAMAIDGPMVGRHIKEGMVLYVEIPGKDARTLTDSKRLNADERDVLEQVIRIKRKEDRFWGM
jgi:translation initiation factor 5B